MSVTLAEPPRSLHPAEFLNSQDQTAIPLAAAVATRRLLAGTLTIFPTRCFISRIALVQTQTQAQTYDEGQTQQEQEQEIENGHCACQCSYF